MTAEERILQELKRLRSGIAAIGVSVQEIKKDVVEIKDRLGRVEVAVLSMQGDEEASQAVQELLGQSKH